MRLLIACFLCYVGYSLSQQLPRPVAEGESPATQNSLPSASPSEIGGQTPAEGTAASENSVPIAEPTTQLPEESNVQTASVSPNAGPRSVAAAHTPAGLPHLVACLNESVRRIESIPSYTATLEQQVQKNGRLLDPEWMDIKFRRAPFSVYLKWHRDGQEAIYVDGQHDGRLLVHPTRGLAQLRKQWRLSPTSSQAMKQSRYPVTELGIEKLSRMALAFYQGAGTPQAEVGCTETRELANGRPALKFIVTFPNDQVSPEYAQSRLTFDEESRLLIVVENLSWGPDGRPGTLLESYRYHGFAVAPTLIDDDFSVHNADYHFE